MSLRPSLSSVRPMSSSAFLVCEWDSEGELPAVREDFLNLDVFGHPSGRRVGLFRLTELSDVQEGSRGPWDALGLEPNVDASVLGSKASFETVKAFYGLTSHVLSEGHGLVIAKTRSVPMGFWLADTFAARLGAESLLDCRMNRTRGGTILSFGGEPRQLEITVRSLRELAGASPLLTPSLRQTVAVDHPWEMELIGSPEHSLRRLYRFADDANSEEVRGSL